MNLLFALLILAQQPPAFLQPRPVPNGARYATVLSVHDGDTAKLDVLMGDEVHLQSNARLDGINAPELATPTGPAAREALKRLLAEPCKAIADLHGRDKYGRLLAVLWCDGATKSVNQQMIDGGFAVPYSGGAR